MHGFNWFALISDQVNGDNIHVITAIFVVLMLVLLCLFARRRLVSVDQALVPSKKFTVANVFEILIENLYSLVEGILGHSTRKHFPFIMGVFIFVFAMNLVGSIPGFSAPTSNINTNLAMALCVFIYFNFVGIKESGFGYLKHFLGPVWWLAWLIGPLELFSTGIRPVTLSLRLFLSLFADHTVLGTFSSLVPIIVPMAFMILGIFIAFVQAFVFTLLTTVYISLASAHEEHH